MLVADADVCFAGDLCFFGVTPLAFQGDPAVWADVLDAVVDLADMIVPGHGPVGGEAEVRDLQGYLLRVRRRRRRRRPRSRRARGTSWLDRDRDAINVERAALLAQRRGRDARRSMLQGDRPELSVPRYFTCSRKKAIVRAQAGFECSSS